MTDGVAAAADPIVTDFCSIDGSHYKIQLQKLNEATYTPTNHLEGNLSPTPPFTPLKLNFAQESGYQNL
jgi:hypothetical protein